MSVTITPREPPPVEPGQITQITSTQGPHGQSVLFALLVDGSLWRLADPAHTGQMEWVEVSLPPVAKAAP